MKKRAFTLVELSISAGLLSLIVLAITSIYSNSSKGFRASSWRLTRQKEAQQLLLHFKEAMEKRSHYNIIRATGKKERLQDVYVVIAGDYYNKIASAANTGIVFASHCTPVIESNPALNTVARQGVFKGYSLECYNKTLSFVQSSNKEYLMRSINSYPGNSLPPLSDDNIVLNQKNGDSTVKVGDVDSIKVTTYDTNLASETSLLTLQITMVMPNSDGKVVVKEEITAKLSDVLNDDKTVSTVISGANQYPTSFARK